MTGACPVTTGFNMLFVTGACPVTTGLNMLFNVRTTTTITTTYPADLLSYRFRVGECYKA